MCETDQSHISSFITMYYVIFYKYYFFIIMLCIFIMHIFIVIFSGMESVSLQIFDCFGSVDHQLL